MHLDRSRYWELVCLSENQAAEAGKGAYKLSFHTFPRGRGGIMAEERQGRGFVMVTGRWLRMWVERRSSRVSDLSKLELSHGQYDK